MAIYCTYSTSRESQTFEIHNPNDDLVEEHGVASHAITTEDMFIKDAFLVFRALCKLTMKPLNTER